MQRQSLTKEFWRLFRMLLIVTAVGLFFGRLQLFLLLGILFYLGWHLYNLLRLAYWLVDEQPVQPPYPNGLWQEVFERVRRLKSHKRKREKFTRFREVASVLPDAVVILGQHNEIQWCNPAAQRMLGLFWPKSMGQPLLKLVRDPVLEEYLARGNFYRPLEFASPANKAQIISLHVTRFGKHNMHLLMARDITQIYHLNQARQDFVANVSHELRTPLTVITGFLENLQTAAQKELTFKRSIELMQDQARRMQTIIQELLAVSHLEMKNQTEITEPVPVPKMLASIIEEARALSGDSKHVITLQAEPQLWLQGDNQELHSAFSNLIFNAVKHTPPRAEIHIRWNADENGAQLTVSDTGEGIPARHISRLTERFYRVDPGRSRQSGGTGLGLAIVKHVLDRHGADLHITSEVGRGSTFTCHFSNSVVLHARESVAEPAVNVPQ